MDGDAVVAIQDQVKSPQAINGFIVRPAGWGIDDPAALIKPGPLAKTLAVSMLGALRDYLTANKDGLDLAHVQVHVAGPASVHVLGPLDARARVRETYLTATAADFTDGFLNRFWSLEEFNLGMQCRFVDADDRKRILGLLSNVKHETVKTALDDGVTQTVQARAGVALVSEVAVPNPVLLSGFRTFRDIVQPSSLYVLRVQSGKSGGLPEAGLYEADGGAWKINTVARVREWLVDALPKDVAVLA